MRQENRPNGRYETRHWWYDEDYEPAFPHFMNDGYAPPDWDLLVALEMIATEEETE